MKTQNWIRCLRLASFPKFLVFLSILFIFIVIEGGCKKKEEYTPSKKLDFITDENELFRLEFSYINGQTDKMVYKAGNDSVVFKFENGLLSSVAHSNGNHTDYIKDGNDIKVMRSWIPDEVTEVFHLNQNNKVSGFSEYSNGELVKTVEYTYSNGNITEQKMTYPEQKLESVYTYDTHRNPYSDIIVFNDFLTYSTNNLLTTNEEEVAVYQYDSDGDVILAKYSESVTYIFVYKWE